MTTAILAGDMAIPISALSSVQISRTVSELTLKQIPMGGTVEDATIVKLYEKHPDVIYVPREYGLDLCDTLKLRVKDQTTEGVDVVWPKVPTLRAEQVPIAQEILDSFEDHYDVRFKARTAFGKTITSLYLAAYYGKATLVIVDQDNLKEQWVEACKERFGMTEKHIGICQGKIWSWKGKSVVIAMIQTLGNRDLTEDFLSYFGMVIFDESHTMGSPVRSQVIPWLRATRRLAVSATPKRKDSLDKVLLFHMGPVRVAAEAQHSASAVYILRNQTVYSWYANVSPKIGRILTEVSEDGARNLMLAEAIIWLYESGRDILLMSDRIGQLNEMKYLLYYMGLPLDAIGMYTGYDPIYTIAKDPTPSRKPYGHEPETEFTPVCVQIKEKKIPTKQLNTIKETSRIVAATYGKFQKGVDEPRLTAGVDLTPRSAAEQVHGRILRAKQEHLPIWVTIVDENNYRLLHAFVQRAGDYLKDNAVLYEWLEDGSIEPCPSNLLSDERVRVEHLKNRCEIRTNNDGRNTLVTKPTGLQSKKQPGKGTDKTTRRRRVA